jgi:2-polyprenyl-6-methoxyphenol hydroxylase-like FAD-dependent oxidoreductase
MTENKVLSGVDCCIAGGGPAGVVLSLLLARQGVEVALLEAHQDFSRDFRGDTVHPSTVALLDQLGLLQRMLELPHVAVPDFPIHYPDGSISAPPDGASRSYSYQIPQHLLLDMLVTEARRYPTFHLLLGARVHGLIESDGQVCGLRYTAADGPHELHATLVVGADGRFSKVRQLAGMELRGKAEPMDVLWLRLPHWPADPERAQGLYPRRDGLLVVMDRPDAWQIGYVFTKGGYQRLRAAGLEALRQGIAERAPWLADRTRELHDWRQTSMLSVEAGRVERWYRPGVLVIGDAAHVMSPVAGVGINYAVQDAIVASNIVGPRLRDGDLRTTDLAAVQRRRLLPTRLMQFLQRRMSQSLEPSAIGRPPLLVRLIMASPPVGELRRRLIIYGGWRPERVRELDPVGKPVLPTRFLHDLGAGVWNLLGQSDSRTWAMFTVAWWPMPVTWPERQPDVTK